MFKSVASIELSVLSRDYLETLPDVVFIQDGIKEEDLLSVLEEVAVPSHKYKCEYQVCVCHALCSL